jgi:FPC/CPF motif-containing protein YcgG
MPIDATEFDEYLQFANELADAAAERVMRALIRARLLRYGGVITAWDGGDRRLHAQLVCELQRSLP